jgi:hypothetical protein
VYRCQWIKGRQFEGKAADSLKNESLRYPLAGTDNLATDFGRRLAEHKVTVPPFTNAKPGISR